ncbi:hypothetical protein BU24DRAFT_417295 [Aaosphaeria arxii CBS 175.79]|uniref:Zn(2)-C6 fungal-type domain-containing protein n=1 Tax=Aaosphaeria arxii CBS 175.79 TaxID=1450172 RepID=A0A6A5YAN9_9PLEO|nr:uncharacterized protein BU24DRAFT_417295 [Aaosphaeria arxii CBS 175.79]KAF2021654.1 hypothetical protein BU24DRAFT_417295 [Aaosphaeria arxii CBS 175.79]
MPRQKVSAACDSCRRRKVKCDAQKPACRPCIIRGELQCNYSSRVKSPRRRQYPLLQQHPQHPQGRYGGDVAERSPMLLSRSANSDSVDRPRSTQAPACSPSFMMADASPGTASTLPITADALLPEQIDDHAPQSADAMTGVGKDPLASVEFFGGSSAASFAAQINSAVDSRLGQNQTHSSIEIADEDSVEASANQEAATTSNSDYMNHLAFVLPLRTFSDRLLQEYYDLVWVILPIHDWAAFKRDYDAVWVGSETSIPLKPLYCMINMALALGTQFSQAVQPDKRRKLGQTFWERALALFDPRIQQRASLQGLQCLLLMGLFLQGTHQSHQCWMVVGSAVRMAQSLGLHLSGTTTSAQNIRDREMLRRTWHGCVFMDRVMSMTFGRPSMIANWLYDAVPLPVMIDDDFLDSQSDPSDVRPDGGTPTIAFFVKSVQLYSIVNDCLLELYMQLPEKAGQSVEQITSVLQFDERLLHWVRSMPEGLQYPSSINASFALQRQRIVLRSRYLHARIVVLRPILTESCLKQVKSDDSRHSASKDQFLSDNLIGHCSKICFESAHEIIRIIYSNLDLETVTGPVPAWWFAVLFVYTAATVLLAERLSQLVSNDSIVEPWAAEPTWNQAIQLLKAYSKVGESAKRCVVALEILLSKIQGCCGPSRVPAEANSGGMSEPIFPSEGQDSSIFTNGGLGPTMDLDVLNLDIDDMLWLNTSAAEILF